MNPQLKQSWIEALRSKRYHQGRGLLRERSRTVTRHCAMGVLFDLVATAAQWARMSTTVTRSATKEVVEEASGYIPPEILGEIGMSNVQQALVAGLNDCGRTFEEIADLIENDFEDELRLRKSVDQMGGGLFTFGPLPAPSVYPDWNGFAGVKINEQEGSALPAMWLIGF